MMQLRITLPGFLGIIICIIPACTDPGKNAETPDSSADTSRMQHNSETILLSKEVKINRYSNPSGSYWDILEVKDERLDSLEANFLIDTTEKNIQLGNSRKSRAFVLWGHYLILSKDQMQVIGLQLYNLKNMRKISSLITEEAMLDTLKNELYLIRDRGNIRHYILRYRLEQDSLLKLDSVENTLQNQQRFGLNEK